MKNKLALSIRDALLGADKEDLIRKATEGKGLAKGGPVHSKTNGDQIPAFLGLHHTPGLSEQEIHRLAEAANAMDPEDELEVAESEFDEVLEDSHSVQEEETVFLVGEHEISPGKYSRPKGFAKAFLIVTEDGHLFYENKKGVLKQITENAFLTHWNKGMSVLVKDE